MSSRYLESSGCLIGSAFFQAGILNKKRSSARLLLYRTDLQSAGPLGLDVKLDELLLTTFKMIETEPTLSPSGPQKREELISHTSLPHQVLLTIIYTLSEFFLISVIQN